MKTPFQTWLDYMHFKSRLGVFFFLLSLLFLFLFFLNLLPRIDPFIPGGAPVVQLFLEGIWFCLMYFGIWRHRVSYRERYNELAYQKIMQRFFFFAILLMGIGLLRPLYVKGPEIVWFPAWLRMIMGIGAVMMGATLYRRGLLSLGIDRVLFVYTVFPERGKQIDSKLYQFLRHPLYAALIPVSLGLALIMGRTAGFLCAFIFIIKLVLWSQIEERELLERFGESYMQYRKKVPAFFPKWRDLGNFWRTLIP